jgi:hypothetical protein
MLADANLISLKEEYLHMLYTDMRLAGYVPVLDIDPWFSRTFDGKNFEFTLTVHGIYVGKSKANKIYGMDGLKAIPMQ